MDSAAWKRAMGDSAWRHLAGDTDPEVVAGILDRVAEIGGILPVRAPKVDPEGRTLLWATGVSGLTAAGLLHYWQSRGHGWLLLNVGVLCRSIQGLLLPRLQEILNAYHAQAEAEGKPPVPIDFYPFVGGDGEVFASDRLYIELTKDLSPPQRRIAKAREHGDG